MSEEITLELKKPFTLGDKRYEVLTFRELKAKDLRSMSSSPTFGDFLNLVGKSAGLMGPEVDQLSASDARAAVGIVADFFTDGQETGE